MQIYELTDARKRLLSPCLMLFRLGDTYPTQHLDVQVRVYLYRWRPKRSADCGKPDVSKEYKYHRLPLRMLAGKGTH